MPVKIAIEKKIKLIFYAEHGESEYGGKILSNNSDKIRNLDEVLENQIGDDPSNWPDENINLKDIECYKYPETEKIINLDIKAFYYSYFFYWDVYENYKSVLGGEIEENNILTDIKERKHFVGSLYDLSAPSKEMVVYPSNKWNSYHIIINYDKNIGKLILNNRLINSFPLKGQKWDSMVRKSKFSKSEDYPYLGDSRWYDFGKFHKGKICFQDHPGEVSFKNVKIKEIK